MKTSAPLPDVKVVIPAPIKWLLFMLTVEAIVLFGLLIAGCRL